jgi:hypothetical protein
MMRKLLVLISLCLALSLGAVCPTYALNPMNVFFKTLCADSASRALANYITAGVILNANDRSEAMVDLSNFTAEPFRNFTATLQAGGLGAEPKYFQIIVRYKLKDGAERAVGSNYVPPPIDGTFHTVALSVTPDLFSPKLPADAELKVISFKVVVPRGGVATAKLTNFGYNSQLIGFEMNARQAFCPDAI